MMDRIYLLNSWPFLVRYVSLSIVIVKVDEEIISCCDAYSMTFEIPEAIAPLFLVIFISFCNVCIILGCLLSSSLKGYFQCMCKLEVGFRMIMLVLLRNFMVM